MSTPTEMELKERQFARKMSKAGWTTYVDEESGRTVTNAFTDEMEKVATLCGMPCEVVITADCLTDDGMRRLFRIGPK